MNSFEERLEKPLSNLCITFDKLVFLGPLAEGARAEEKNHRGHGEEMRPLLRALCASVVQTSSRKRSSVRAAKVDKPILHADRPEMTAREVCLR